MALIFLPIQPSALDAIADGKVRSQAARQYRADAVGEFDGLVVDDVVGHTGGAFR